MNMDAKLFSMDKSVLRAMSFHNYFFAVTITVTVAVAIVAFGRRKKKPM